MTPPPSLGHVHGQERRGSARARAWRGRVPAAAFASPAGPQDLARTRPAAAANANVRPARDALSPRGGCILRGAASPAPPPRGALSPWRIPPRAPPAAMQRSCRAAAPHASLAALIGSGTVVILGCDRQQLGTCLPAPRQGGQRPAGQLRPSPLPPAAMGLGQCRGPGLSRVPQLPAGFRPLPGVGMWMQSCTAPPRSASPPGFHAPPSIARSLLFVPDLEVGGGDGAVGAVTLSLRRRRLKMASCSSGCHGGRGAPGREVPVWGQRGPCGTQPHRGTQRPACAAPLGRVPVPSPAAVGLGGSWGPRDLPAPCPAPATPAARPCPAVAFLHFNSWD